MQSLKNTNKYYLTGADTMKLTNWQPLDHITGSAAFILKKAVLFNCNMILFEVTFHV